MSLIAPNGNGHAGGLGEPHRSKPRSYSNDRLFRRAVRGGWDIPPPMKAESLVALRSIINDPDARPRERTGAVRAFATICKAELDAVRTAALVKRLGQADDTREKAEADGISLREHFDEVRRRAREEAENNPPNGTHQP